MAVSARADTMATPSPEYLAESNAPAILCTVGVFGFIALATVCLRFFVRGAILRYTGSDDLVLGLSMIVGIAVFICFAGEASNGLGRHAEIIAEHQELFLHWEFAHSLLSLFGIALVKISVALLLLRIVPQKHYRRFLWAIIVFLVGYTVICTFTILFACTPISANWDISVRPTAKCFSMTTYTALGIANSVFSMLTDSILAILPIPIVYGLQLNRRTKIALMMVLSLGFIAVGCGSVKIYFQYSVLSNPDAHFKDQFFTWAALELYLGIIACSLPSLRPLVAVALKSAKSSFGSTRHGTAEPTSKRRSHHASFGYRKHPDLESSVSERELKTDFTTTTSPAGDDFHRAPMTRENSYFGVNTTVSYTVDAERSFSGPIPLEDMVSTSSSSNKEGAVVNGGIMRTMKVVTHSESVAAPQLSTSVPSPYEYEHGDYLGAKRLAADSSSVKELLDGRSAPR